MHNQPNQTKPKTNKTQQNQTQCFQNTWQLLFIRSYSGVLGFLDDWFNYVILGFLPFFFNISLILF